MTSDKKCHSFFVKGGIALNDTEWIQDFADKRLQYGVSQTKLAVMAGISREHLSRIESGKVAVTEEMKVKLLEALEKFNPEAPPTMLFDYVRIRFPTLDIGHIIKDILLLNIQYMIHEDFGHYSYTEHYYIGDIFVYTSPDEEKGVLLELKGKGCRQFESYLLAQERSWYDFLMDALVDGGVMKRLDLAINDHTGMLDIPELTEKCRNEECVSVFRSFKSYASGELVKHEEQDKAGMGYTLYIGSLKSEVYFCVYEKSYEQYIKLGIPIEEAPIKNRFEIRLKNERAYYAVRDLLTYYDAERTAFSIINRYVRFVDKEADKKRSDWKLSVRWAWFIGENREPLKLTTKPEPYTLDRTLRWIQRQVDPTLKMLETITAKTGIDYLKEIRKSTKLTEKHYKIIEQQTTSTEDVILEKEN
ncbi:XRE family transcriptional regulator [Coprobacillus sp. TF10-10]|nr:XRE family transcriptional regulator [Coprobacillus sp. TF10-10]